MFEAIGGALRSIDKQEKVLTDTFDTNKQAEKLATRDGAQDSVAQACGDIAAVFCSIQQRGSPANAQLTEGRGQGRLSTIGLLAVAGFVCPSCGESDS